MPIGQYEFGSQLALESITKERVRAILKTLDMRDVPVSEAQRRRIESCTDLETLEVWFTRAYSVKLAEDLF